MKEKIPFHEFFAGSGLVSNGLSRRFEASWANDISEKKMAVYVSNLGSGVFHLGDVSKINGGDLPEAKLSWASFPCQDLSLAGKIGGIHSERSGLVWQWLRIIDEMGCDAPRVVCLENVVGLISSRGGNDYEVLHEALISRGYKCGAVLVNAELFVPQSRPRVFVIATKGDIPDGIVADAPSWLHSKQISALGDKIDGFVWWSAERPAPRAVDLDEVVTEAPFDKNGAVALVPPSHVKKFVSSGRDYATGYRRTRNGKSVMELRCDGVAGCLRTPAGGSSKQYLFHRNGDELEARLLTIREVARLMGAPDNWKLPGSYNDGYYAMGDAVASPVAEWLGDTFLEPLVEAAYGS